MGQRYDTVMEMHARVRSELEQIAEDPRFNDPAEVVKRLDRVLHDEFASLRVHAREMSARDMVGVLGSAERVGVYTQLLTVRAVSLAIGGKGDAAAGQARRVLELHIESALVHGELALDARGVEQLQALMEPLTLQPMHQEALAMLQRQRY